MKTLLIGTLSATLIGCSCPLPPQGVVQTCTSQGCFSSTAATTPIEPKRAPFRPEPVVKSRKVAMAVKPTPAKPRNKTEPVEEKANSRTIMGILPSAQPAATPAPVPKNATTTIGGKTEGPRTAETSEPPNKATTAIGGKTEDPTTGQPSETSDPVLKKAKITVAAKMESPASAEFVDMKRVMKDGRSVEAICGHVKGKKKSSETTGERPFLYLVKDDEAFIVDSNPDSIAAIAYRAHCTNPNSH
jgi:hypothetical protein